MVLRMLRPVMGIVTIILMGIGVAQTGVLGSNTSSIPSTNSTVLSAGGTSEDLAVISPDSNLDKKPSDPGNSNGNGNARGNPNKPTTTTTPTSTTGSSTTTTASTTTTKPSSTTTTTKPSSTTTTTKPSSTTTTTAASTTTTAPGTTSGVAIYPGDSIQAAVNSHPAGTTFIIKSGTHHKQQVDAKDRDVFVGESGAILSGDNTTEYAFWGWKADNVTISGLVIENYKNKEGQGVIRGTSRYWVVQNNEIRYNGGIGISSAGDGWKILDNYIHHNAQLGIRGTGANLLIQGNEIAYNNYQHQYNANVMAGGTKWYKTTNLVVRGNYSHDNAGPGLKTDADNKDVLYENNRVINNEGAGIFHEISYDAVIRNNTVIGNGSPSSGGLDGAGILVSNSQNVEIYGNTVKNNADGIAAKEANRGSGAYGVYDVKNLWVHDNTIVMNQGETGITDFTNSSGGKVYTSWNNRFDRNTYTIPAGSDSFRWGNAPISLAEWLKTGNDANSSFTET